MTILTALMIENQRVDKGGIDVLGEGEERVENRTWREGQSRRTKSTPFLEVLGRKVEAH